MDGYILVGSISDKCGKQPFFFQADTAGLGKCHTSDMVGLESSLSG